MRNRDVNQMLHRTCQKGRAMEPDDVEAFRRRMVTRIAKSLLGDFERGNQVALRSVPKIVAGINIGIAPDDELLRKHVEYELNELASKRRERFLRADYTVSVNRLNGICRFSACVRPA